MYATSALLARELIAIACDVLTIQLIRSILAVGNGTAEQRALIATLVAHKVQLLVATAQIAWIPRRIALVCAILTVLEAIAKILAIDALLCAATLKSRRAIGTCRRRNRCWFQLGYTMCASAVERKAIGTTTNGTLGRIQTHARTLGHCTRAGLLWQWLRGHIEDTQIDGIASRLQMHSGTEGVRLICVMHTKAPNRGIDVIHPVNGTIMLHHGKRTKLIRFQEQLTSSAIEFHALNGAQSKVTPIDALIAPIHIQTAGPTHGHVGRRLGQQLLVRAIHPGAVDARLA